MKRPERICANFTNRSWLFRPSQSRRRSLTQSSNRRMWKSMKSLSGPPPRISELPMNMTATIKRIVTRWTLPALMLIAAGFVCDGLTEFGHHAFLIAGGIALGIGIGRESRYAATRFFRNVDLRTREIRTSTNSPTMNHITSLLRGIIRTHVVLGLTFTAAILPLLAGNRPASETAAAPTVRNVVLAHGAFADGSSWAKVIPLLEAKGLHVTAVQNPLSSLADDVAATKRAIANQDGPVILVGHSWDGMVISEAGNDPKVAGLVYVAAIVPDEGQSAGDVVK